MKLKEIIKKYADNKEHLENTSRLSLLIFEKIKPHFLRLQNYDNKEDLLLLEAGALLHDIGIYFEKAYGISHHKAGAKYVMDNPPDEIKEEDIKTLSCLVRYHRKSFPKESHQEYKCLSQKERAKVNFLGAIIRLADAFDFSHLNLTEDFSVEYYKEINVLTFIISNNIMSNSSMIDCLNRKKDFFEYAYSTKVSFRGN